MNGYLIAAAALAGIVGTAHAALGEWLVFRRLRHGTVVPTVGGSALLERHVRILWASWHIATVFGWGLAAVLVVLAQPSSPPALTRDAASAVSLAMFASGALVLFGTKGRHPGWVGLFGVAILTYFGRVA